MQANKTKQQLFPQETRGKFSSTVKVEWVPGSGRLMRVLETIRFTDSEGLNWFAPEGSIVDGASIPRLLWTAVGSPFVGLYRRAAVLHDVYCANKPEHRPSTAVHKMFKEAMLADGVSPIRAWYMYNAVRMFGPRWK